MPFLTWTYQDISTVVTLDFAAEHARLTRPKTMPIQITHIAENGKTYVYERSSNEEVVLYIDFEDLIEDDITTPFTTKGYNSLKSFLQNTVNWKQRSFTVTDPDGETYTARYWEGFDNLEEATGRSRKKGFWSGTITLRKIL